MISDKSFKDIVVRSIEETDAGGIAGYHQRNYDHFKAWSPYVSLSEHSVKHWEVKCKTLCAEQENGDAAYFVALRGEMIVAQSSLTQISRGVFQAAYIGFSVDKAYEGTGLAFYLNSEVAKLAFNELGLRRLMAGVMPHNNRSRRLLARMGFKRDGFAQAYLKINQQWQDHILMSLTQQTFHSN